MCSVSLVGGSLEITEQSPKHTIESSQQQRLPSFTQTNYSLLTSTVSHAVPDRSYSATVTKHTGNLRATTAAPRTTRGGEILALRQSPNHLAGGTDSKLFTLPKLHPVIRLSGIEFQPEVATRASSLH